MAANSEGTALIRPARTGDKMQCADIYLAGRRQAFHWQPVETFRLEDYERSVEDEDVWVAEVDGRVVGFVSIYPKENFVHNLFIHPDWQHRGLGRRLLNAAVQRMNGSARLKCVARNRRACAFYAANGWQPESTAEAELGPFILYRKDLHAGRMRGGP